MAKDWDCFVHCCACTYTRYSLYGEQRKLHSPPRFWRTWGFYFSDFLFHLFSPTLDIQENLLLGAQLPRGTGGTMVFLSKGISALTQSISLAPVKGRVVWAAERMQKVRLV